MWLQVGWDSGAAQAIEITEPLLIGRDDRCDVVLDDEKVSRRHALVTPEADGTATLRDLDSANGSFVNGRRVDAAVVLVGGEQLRFGNTVARILESDPNASTEARPPDPRIGKTIGRYRVERFIAEGNMGVVYLAQHLRLGRHDALKVLHPRLFSDAASRERFDEEPRLASAILHPNIVTIYDAGEEDGELYIAMRFVEGADLGHLIASRGALAPGKAIGIVSQAGAALDAAHAKGLIHRDVKPANILVTSAEDPAGEGRVFLCDFGITKHAGSKGQTRAGRAVGTPYYMAPERWRGEEADARTDIYSLGCVLYEALTGVAPFDGGSEEALMYSHLTAERPRVSDRRAGLGREIDEVLQRAMAASREDRFASAGEFVAAASAALDRGTEADGRKTVVDSELATASGASRGPRNAGTQPQHTADDVLVQREATTPEDAGYALVPAPWWKRRDLAAMRRAGFAGVGVLAAAVIIGLVISRGGGTPASPKPSTAATSVLAAVPAPPGAFRVQAVSAGEIDLHWTAGSGQVLGYRIYRDGNPLLVAPADRTVFRDLSVEAGKQYLYGLEAFNPTGASTRVEAGTSTGSAPSLSDARIAGAWTIVRTYTSTGLEGTKPGDTRTDSWTFEPQCQTGSCPITLTGVINSTTTAGLSQAGGIYAGSAVDTFDSSSCGTEHDTMAIRIHVVEAGFDGKGEYLAQRVSGEADESITADGCTAASARYTFEGMPTAETGDLIKLLDADLACEALTAADPFQAALANVSCNRPSALLGSNDSLQFHLYPNMTAARAVFTSNFSTVTGDVANCFAATPGVGIGVYGLDSSGASLGDIVCGKAGVAGTPERRIFIWTHWPTGLVGYAAWDAGSRLGEWWKDPANWLSDSAQR